MNSKIFCVLLSVLGALIAYGIGEKVIEGRLPDQVSADCRGCEQLPDNGPFMTDPNGGDRLNNCLSDTCDNSQKIEELKKTIAEATQAVANQKREAESRYALKSSFCEMRARLSELEVRVGGMSNSRWTEEDKDNTLRSVANLSRQFEILAEEFARHLVCQPVKVYRIGDMNGRPVLAKLYDEDRRESK